MPLALRNASIGRGKLNDNDNDIESSMVGSFGIERINDAGRRLRVFMETHQIAALATFFNKKYFSITWTHPVSKFSYQIDHIFTLRENLRHFSDAGSVSGQFVDSDHRAVKATLRSLTLVAPKKKKVLKDDRHKLMRLDYAILQSEEGRDELARRALEILKSKSEDKTSYEAIANALHLATEEVLPKRARAHACRTVMVLSKCHGSSRFDKSAEQCVRRLSYQTSFKTSPFCIAKCSQNTTMCY